MSSAISNSKLEGRATLDRLQQIQISAHDRLLAEAHLARAEFLADVVIRSIEVAKRVLRTLVLRPFRRASAAFN